MGALSGETALPFSFLPSFSMGPAVDPIALRTANTLWSFGHSECNRVKGKKFLLDFSRVKS